jgi:hypothetical protein
LAGGPLKCNAPIHKEVAKDETTPDADADPVVEDEDANEALENDESFLGGVEIDSVEGEENSNNTNNEEAV